MAVAEVVYGSHVVIGDSVSVRVICGSTLQMEIEVRLRPSQYDSEAETHRA